MKPLVGVFAHPDDEAFGPSGTLAKFAKERDVYLICVTDGAEGKNSSAKTHALAEIREEELRNSAHILGIKEVYFLGYRDGSLCNSLYHEIADKLEEQLRMIRPEIVMTFEPRGISGHLDHIAVSFITTFVVKKLPFIKEIWQHVLLDMGKSVRKDYFIYFPRGYKKEEISTQIDVTDVWDTKIKAMQAHESQKHDMDNVLARQEKSPKLENFLVRKRNEL